MKTIRIVTHYSESDPEFISDYVSIQVFEEETGRLLVEYGDGYHDDGQGKVEGFVQALEICFPDLIVQEEDIADGEA